MQTAFTLPMQSFRLKENQGVCCLIRDFGFGGRFGSGCVLRTASESISRSSAFVFGCTRVKVLCHWVMDSMWGCRRQN
jgi:hypothetical protein